MSLKVMKVSDSNSYKTNNTKIFKKQNFDSMNSQPNFGNFKSNNFNNSQKNKLILTLTSFLAAISLNKISSKKDKNLSIKEPENVIKNEELAENSSFDKLIERTHEFVKKHHIDDDDKNFKKIDKDVLDLINLYDLSTKGSLDTNQNERYEDLLNSFRGEEEYINSQLYAINNNNNSLLYHFYRLENASKIDKKSPEIIFLKEATVEIYKRVSRFEKFLYENEILEKSQLEKETDAYQLEQLSTKELIEKRKELMKGKSSYYDFNKIDKKTMFLMDVLKAKDEDAETLIYDRNKDVFKDFIQTVLKDKSYQKRLQDMTDLIFSKYQQNIFDELEVFAKDMEKGKSVKKFDKYEPLNVVDTELRKRVSLLKDFLKWIDLFNLN